MISLMCQPYLGVVTTAISMASALSFATKVFITADI